MRFSSDRIRSQQPSGVEPVFSLPFDVRDYECDLQGVVNNAVYLHYLEHTRHQYLKSVGMDFADYTARGIHLVVVRSEVDYLAPLRSGDRFIVTVSPVRVSRIRFGFLQNIFLQPGNKPMLKALVVGVALDPQRRPYMPAEFEPIFP